MSSSDDLLNENIFNLKAMNADLKKRLREDISSAESLMLKIDRAINARSNLYRK